MYAAPYDEATEQEQVVQLLRALQSMEQEMMEDEQVNQQGVGRKAAKLQGWLYDLIDRRQLK